MKKIALAIIPPLWAIFFFALAYVAHSLLYRSGMLAVARSYPLAVIFVVCGGVMIFWTLSRLWAAGTEIAPNSPANVALVQSGPYAFSRNPMYLGMIFVTLGVALAVGSLSFYLVPLAMIVLLNFLFVPYEEEKMARQFGAVYQEYANRVRRWT